MELEPEQISFCNPNFKTSLEGIFSKTKEELKFNNKDIKFNLQKLVLCGKGAQIGDRSNSTKEGTFGSLIVQLPSLFTGGSSHIQHCNERKTDEFDRPEAQYGIIYAAHFSNCDSQMTPVESGFRTFLVYDLIEKGSKISFNDFDEKRKITPKISSLLSKVMFLSFNLVSFLLIIFVSRNAMTPRSSHHIIMISPIPESCRTQLSGWCEESPFSTSVDLESDYVFVAICLCVCPKTLGQPSRVG